MLDELYDTNDLQPEFVEETEKPYDKYLKLHNYDPKTNTIEIDGKRVNAGSKGSNKERNRMNKLLRENDYDPKSGTYKSDMKVKDPKSGEMKNQRVKLNFDAHRPTQATSYRKFLAGVDFDKSNINVTPKDLAKKPKDSGSTLKHEEGHIVDHSDQFLGRLNASKAIRDVKDEAERVNKEDFKDLKYSDKNLQMQHANDPQEKFADLYGELHNKQGFGGTKTSMNRFKSTIKDPISKEKKDEYKDALEYNELNREYKLGHMGSDKIMDDILSDDSDYNRMKDQEKEYYSQLNKIADDYYSDPEERLYDKLGYSEEEIEDLKKSGKFEDVLKEHKLDDESLRSRLEKYSNKIDENQKDMQKYRREIVNDKTVRRDIKKNIASRRDAINKEHDEQENRIHDYMDAKKNLDAELDSRSNFVERKIRELAEKDPEVKRKLAEYDAAIARRKQKLEKRKANKAEARAKREASDSTTESYYVPFEPEVDIVF